MSRADVGVYVHVPFCERVCPYCDFAVVGVRELGAAQEQRTVDALLRELEARRADFAGRTLASLYFGGGTPSLCRPESIARIAAAVRAAFPSGAPAEAPPEGPPKGPPGGPPEGSPEGPPEAPPGGPPEGSLETTLEVNPSTLERERLPGFRAAGVNRVSLGVQSFDDGVLKRLGRAHRADEARRSLRACREAGFDALSLDLIFAAPGQGLAQLERDLAETLAFGPEHVSAYELGIETGTPFATAAARGQLALPDEELALAMFDAVEATLGAAGYEHYEIANHARPGFAAVHNQRYWRRLPVLGLGPGACSTDPRSPAAPFGVRRANLRDHAAWLARVEAGESPEATPPERLDAPTARGEALFLALRTRRGVDAAAFAAEFGQPPRGFFGAAIEELVAQALLRETAAGDLRLTARGRRLSDSVFGRFVGGVA